MSLLLQFHVDFLNMSSLLYILSVESLILEIYLIEYPLSLSLILKCDRTFCKLKLKDEFFLVSGIQLGGYPSSLARGRP